MHVWDIYPVNFTYSVNNNGTSDHLTDTWKLLHGKKLLLNYSDLKLKGYNIADIIYYLPLWDCVLISKYQFDDFMH
jgi:hypothetical protein